MIIGLLVAVALLALLSRRVPIPYPILLGNKRTAYLYGDVEGLPLAFFVDKAGRVAAIQLGPGSRKSFEQTIVALMKER